MRCLPIVSHPWRHRARAVGGFHGKSFPTILALLRRHLADTYSDLGHVYAMTASAETASGHESLLRYREAREWYRRCLDLLTAMQEEGVLAASDANWLDATAAEVAKCDVAIEQLENR